MVRHGHVMLSSWETRLGVGSDPHPWATIGRSGLTPGRVFQPRNLMSGRFTLVHY